MEILIGFSVDTTAQCFGATPAPISLVSVSAPGDQNPQQNVVLMCNSIVGGRTKWLFQGSGTTTVAKSAYMKFTVQEQRNTKSDTFGTNATLVGNRPEVNNVGHLANCAQGGGNDGFSVTANGRWLGEVVTAGDVYGSTATPVVVNWTNDQSYYGGGASGGDYIPGPGNALPAIPSSMAPYPVDMKGRSIDSAVSARIGALQPG